ncbi:MAG: glycine cleavage system protein T [Betaproteobacteria bacterium RBG_16_64_18]|nr:MAG: glycine cleavage system protein T [Betaproteobacteria bacterium RBG_16_64_18]OGA15340.1 MAG: glycine cleavage system protein T [Betaproteobacteria bacterium RIFCSPLOWO2_02_FULL_65_20]OGA43084.1 MAG: glycine cleavage system protein T [Betaproteobacteria bacterium RIFCSPLOWO2_12_FULL_65_110]
MLRQTPLTATHRRLGARMVDFGGWEMPLHYGSQIEEHHRVRNDAGVFDVSHMLALDILGPDSRAFLRYALANDVARLERPGRALYSCLLNQRGCILDDLIVYFTGEFQYRVVVNAGTAEKDLAWIRALRQRGTPDITPQCGLCMLAAQGPNARARVWDALPETRNATEPLLRFHAAQCGEFFVARTGYTGEDGFELMFPAVRADSVWNALMRAGAAPCGLGARDTLRLEAGMNLYGQDMDETVTPAESGLAWTVDLSGGREFVGRRALEHGHPLRKLVGLVLLGRGVLRAHQRVVSAHGEGLVTSGGFAPTLGRSIALARVPNAVNVGDAVHAQVRERLLEARVVKPPFVRNGRSLIGPIGEPE